MAAPHVLHPQLGWGGREAGQDRLLWQRLQPAVAVAVDVRETASHSHIDQDMHRLPSGEVRGWQGVSEQASRRLALPWSSCHPATHPSLHTRCTAPLQTRLLVDAARNITPAAYLVERRVGARLGRRAAPERRVDGAGLAGALAAEGREEQLAVQEPADLRVGWAEYMTIG